MWVFVLRWKTCFILNENLVSGGVSSDVSLGIKNHPPNPNGSHLSAFDCMNNQWVWEVFLKPYRSIQQELFSLFYVYELSPSVASKRGHETKKKNMFYM